MPYATEVPRASVDISTHARDRDQSTVPIQGSRDQHRTTRRASTRSERNVHRQELGLHGLQPGVRIHGAGPGVLRRARLHRAKALHTMPQCPQGAARGWFSGWRLRRLHRWQLVQRRRLRRPTRTSRTTRVAPSNLLGLRQGDHGPLPAYQRQAGVLRQLLLDPTPSALSPAALRATRTAGTLRGLGRSIYWRKIRAAIATA